MATDLRVRHMTQYTPPTPFAQGHMSELYHPVDVEVTLRLTVGRSVWLGVGHPFGAHDQILLFPFFC
jgi:hypothetical protein